MLDRRLDAPQIRRLLDDLADDNIDIRGKAFALLEESAHDPAVWTALEKAGLLEEKGRLKTLVDAQTAIRVTSPMTLGRIRGIWALELLGGRAALEEIAHGPAYSRQTMEAKKALSRLPR